MTRKSYHHTITQSVTPHNYMVPKKITALTFSTHHSFNWPAQHCWLHTHIFHARQKICLSELHQQKSSNVPLVHKKTSTASNHFCFKLVNTRKAPKLFAVMTAKVSIKMAVIKQNNIKTAFFIQNTHTLTYSTKSKHANKRKRNRSFIRLQANVYWCACGDPNPPKQPRMQGSKSGGRPAKKKIESNRWSTGIHHYAHGISDLYLHWSLQGI